MHSNNVVHFAIHADNVERARTFYTQVFGWKFAEWGPPNFYLITTGTDQDRGIRGALQERPEPVSTSATVGYECSVSVEDIGATTSAILAHGGEIVTSEVDIPTVGRLIKFKDTEGNIACAIQYHEGVI